MIRLMPRVYFSLGYWDVHLQLQSMLNMALTSHLSHLSSMSTITSRPAIHTQPTSMSNSLVPLNWFESVIVVDAYWQTLLVLHRWLAIQVVRTKGLLRHVYWSAFHVNLAIEFLFIVMGILLFGLWSRDSYICVMGICGILCSYRKLWH